MAKNTTEYHLLTPYQTGASVSLYLRKNKLNNQPNQKVLVSRVPSKSKKPGKNPWALSLEKEARLIGGGPMPIDLFIEVSSFIEDNYERLVKQNFYELTKFSMNSIAA